MDSFQQSGLRISRRSFVNLRVHSAISKEGAGVVVNEVDRLRDLVGGVAGSSTADPFSSTRDKAIMKEIEPLSNSTMRTADAAEYFSEGDTETRE